MLKTETLPGGVVYDLPMDLEAALTAHPAALATWPAKAPAVDAKNHRGRECRNPAPAGVTGVVLLAESHLALHTWPELGVVTLDVYVCNRGIDNGARAQQLLNALIAVFGPEQIERHRLVRGAPTAAH